MGSRRPRCQREAWRVSGHLETSSASTRVRGAYVWKSWATGSIGDARGELGGSRVNLIERQRDPQRERSGLHRAPRARPNDGRWLEGCRVALSCRPGYRLGSPSVQPCHATGRVHATICAVTKAELHDLVERLPDSAVDAAAILLAEISEGRIDPDQAWFWTREWQTMEREAEADRLAGRVTGYDGDAEFLAALDARTKPLDADT